MNRFCSLFWKKTKSKLESNLREEPLDLSEWTWIDHENETKVSFNETEDWFKEIGANDSYLESDSSDSELPEWYNVDLDDEFELDLWYLDMENHKLVPIEFGDPTDVSVSRKPRKLPLWYVQAKLEFENQLKPSGSNPENLSSSSGQTGEIGSVSPGPLQSKNIERTNVSYEILDRVGKDRLNCTEEPFCRLLVTQEATENESHGSFCVCGIEASGWCCDFNNKYDDFSPQKPYRDVDKQRDGIESEEESDEY